MLFAAGSIWSIVNFKLTSSWGMQPSKCAFYNKKTSQQLAILPGNIDPRMDYCMLMLKAKCAKMACTSFEPTMDDHT